MGDRFVRGAGTETGLLTALTGRDHSNFGRSPGEQKQVAQSLMASVV